MTAVAVVLLHSPLTGPSAWGPLAEVLRERGHAVVVVDVTDDDDPPYAARYVARAALQVAAVAPAHPLLLVGHSGAGPLLAQVGATQRAARRRLAGYLFLDAGLPRTRPATWLELMETELMETEEADFARVLHDRLHAGARFPDWDEADLADEVPDPEARSALVASLRPRGHDFFTEPLPCPQDWPDAPCAYLRTSAAYDAVARVARTRGWPTYRLDLGHFAALRDPCAVADVVARVVTDL